MVIHNTLNRGRELLERAHASGITLELVDGQVRMRRPESAPADLLEEMRAERDAVVAALETGWPTADENRERDEKGWIYLAGPIRDCCVCGKPCQSWDPDDHPRHPTCAIEGAA